MASSRAELLALVERSPACVAAHDRAAWLSLFGTDGVVEDPVGSAPVRRDDGSLERFYDTFIAPHQIRFEIRRDCVLGNDVFRDASIHTKVRPGVAVIVPAYLLYQVGEVDGSPHVRRMAAHWRLVGMFALAMRLGPRAWLAMSGLFIRMLRLMGISWVAAYVASLWRGIGRRGLRAVAALAAAVATRDQATIRRLFSPDAQIELGPRRLGPDTFLDALPAGCRLVIEEPRAVGNTTAFRFALRGAEPADGLCLVEHDARDGRIVRARFFP